MDLPKKQRNRREIVGFFEIHQIWKKTPKFGGGKNQTMIFWESLKAPFRTNWPGEAARGPIGLKKNK